MNTPKKRDLYVCAKDWQEAQVLAEALASGKIEIGPRHTIREDAENWCKRLNDCVPNFVRTEHVYHVQVTKHYGPDSVIYSFANIGA